LTPPLAKGEDGGAKYFTCGVSESGGRLKIKMVEKNILWTPKRELSKTVLMNPSQRLGLNTSLA
jgi:hypothetical protein